jgi:tetrahydromethanopterin S-methyltransferase subunit A
MYFQVNVELVDFNDKGKQQKIKEQYLVDSESVTEAEAKVIKMFEDEGNQMTYMVKSVRETKILQVIL